MDLGVPRSSRGGGTNQIKHLAPKMAGSDRPFSRQGNGTGNSRSPRRCEFSLQRNRSARPRGSRRRRTSSGDRSSGRELSNLVASVSDPMVIALDAPWGSGKTTFLKMWAGHLRQAGFPVVFFDAFENDYIDDAFAAIAGQIVGLAHEKRKADEPAAKRFADKAVATGKVLLRSGLKVAVKAGQRRALSAAGLSEEFKEAIKDVATELRRHRRQICGRTDHKASEQKDAIEAFRQALADLPALLCDLDEIGAAKPLIFVIDELDSRRPAFALYFGARLSISFLSKVCTLCLGHILVNFETLLLRHSHKALSFRTIERIVVTFSVAMAFTTADNFRPPPIVIGLCILKVIDPDLFAKAKQAD